MAKPDPEEKISRVASRRRNNGIFFGLLKSIELEGRGEQGERIEIGLKNRLLDEKVRISRQLRRLWQETGEMDLS